MSYSYPKSSANGPIWLSGLDCPPSTSSADLRACPQATVGQNSCTADDDIILSCFKGGMTCSDRYSVGRDVHSLSCVSEGSIRLVDSEADPFTDIVTAGRLEIYLRGEWGTVCDNEFSFLEVDIACRQLGYHFASDQGNILNVNG